MIKGYCLNERGKNEVLFYKCNGWRVYFVLVLSLVLFFKQFFVLVADYFNDYLFASNFLGIAISLIYFIKGKLLESEKKILKTFRAPTVDTGFIPASEK